MPAEWQPLLKMLPCSSGPMTFTHGLDDKSNVPLPLRHDLNHFGEAKYEQVLPKSAIFHGVNCGGF